MAELAVDMYVESIMKDARKYGSSDAEDGFSYKDNYKYIGSKRNLSKANAESEMKV